MRSKIVQVQADYDYEKKLNKEEQEFLLKFTKEYYGGEFSEEPLHETKALRQDCNSRNYQIRNDLFSIKHSCEQLTNLKDEDKE